jgi:hypothetical protein
VDLSKLKRDPQPEENLEFSLEWPQEPANQNLKQQG